MSRTSWWARAKARQLLAHVTARVSVAEQRGAGGLAAPGGARPVRRDARRRPPPRPRRRRACCAARACATATCWPPGCSTTAPRATPARCRGSRGRSGERFGPWVVGLARRVPGWDAALDRLAGPRGRVGRRSWSAPGLPAFAVELVRYQSEPRDPRYGARSTPRTRPPDGDDRRPAPRSRSARAAAPRPRPASRCRRSTGRSPSCSR